MLQKRSIWRAIFSALVGGMGGVSLTNTIFPFIAARVLGSITLEALLGVRDSILLVALVWAGGGAIVGWLGGARTGAVVMGLCGLLTGLWLGAFAAKGDLPMILLAIFIGLLYSIPGGLLMGYVFPKPVSEA
jgi:hypothetical protein